MLLRLSRFALPLILGLALAANAASTTADPIDALPPLPQTDTNALAGQLKIGDVVFIRVPALPFRKVAAATDSWTNHVGIVVDVSGDEPLVAESKLPRSTTTPLSRFVSRSEGGRVAVTRLGRPLSAQENLAIKVAVMERANILYDTGFNLHSSRQFCSRYVREVLNEATGIKVGEVENFTTLLARHPGADVTFWRVWFFGGIPWERETVTPASVLQSHYLHPVFDGVVTKVAKGAA